MKKKYKCAECGKILVAGPRQGSHHHEVHVVVLPNHKNQIGSRCSQSSRDYFGPPVNDV